MFWKVLIIRNRMYDSKIVIGRERSSKFINKEHLWMKHRNPYKSINKGTLSECPKYTRISTDAGKDGN